MSKRNKRHDWSEREEKPDSKPEPKPEDKDWARELYHVRGPYLGNWARDGKLHNPPTGVCAWIAGSEAPWVFASEEEKRKRGPVQQMRRVPCPD